MASLRDRLRSRERPHTTYPLQVDDTTEQEKALRATNLAHRQALLSSKRGEADPKVKALKKAFDEAQAAYDACFVQVFLRALRPEDLEALTAKHPPRDDNDDDTLYNTKTFPRELFLECVEDESMTRADWEDLLDNRLSTGERAELYVLVQTLNVRGPASSIPKG